MKRKRSKGKRREHGLLLSIAKAAGIGCLVTAGLTLLLAISLKWDWIAIDRLDGINSIIKLLSAAVVGCLMRSDRPHGWVYAGIAGCAYLIAAFAVFAVCAGSFRASTRQLIDFLTVFAVAASVEIFLSVLLTLHPGKEPRETSRPIRT